MAFHYSVFQITVSSSASSNMLLISFSVLLISIIKFFTSDSFIFYIFVEVEACKAKPHLFSNPVWVFVPVSSCFSVLVMFLLLCDGGFGSQSCFHPFFHNLFDVALFLWLVMGGLFCQSSVIFRVSHIVYYLSVSTWMRWAQDPPIFLRLPEFGLLKFHI